MYETPEQEIAEFLVGEIRSDFNNRDFIRLTLERVCLDSKLRKDVVALWSASFKGHNHELFRRLERFNKEKSTSARNDLRRLIGIIETQARGLGVLICLQPELTQALMEKQARHFAKMIAKSF